MSSNPSVDIHQLILDVTKSSHVDLAQARRHHDKLSLIINEHAHRYYVLDDPILGDADYDKLFRALLQLEEQFSELQTADSPTQRIGGVALKQFDSISG